MSDHSPPPLPLSTRLAETIKRFWDLGFTAFGGPGVHVVILRRRFVEKYAWIDTTTFNDLFALGNALPGPGSTQLAFSIATVKGGMLCGLVAFLFWSIPGAAGMAALAAGVRSFPDKLPPIVLALLTGLNASAVGLIALAAYQLANSAVSDATSRLVLITSASFGICYHAPWMYPVLVASGGIATLVYDMRHRLLGPVRRQRERRRHTPGAEITSSGQLSEEVELAAIPATRTPTLTTTAATDVQFQEELVPLPPLAKTRSTGADRGGWGDDVLQGNGKRGDEEDTKPDYYSGTAISADATATVAEQGGLRHRHVPSSTSTTTAPAPTSADDERLRTTLMVPSPRWAYTLGATFLLSIVILVIVRAKYPAPQTPRAFDFFVNMVIAGVIIFGGGPVVIPLLRGYTVENGWVSSRDFLLGFAILQAFPGPNFNFAAYLGVLCVPSAPVLGAFLGWLGIFTPGILLKLALLPLYDSWRTHNVAKSVLRGLNAAATGLVFTAVWQLFLVGYIYQPATGATTSVGTSSTTASGPLTADPWWGVVATWSFVLTQWFKLPPAITIALGGVAGLAWFGVVGESGVMGV